MLLDRNEAVVAGTFRSEPEDMGLITNHPEAGCGGWVKKKGSRPLNRSRIQADGSQLGGNTENVKMNDGSAQTISESLAYRSLIRSVKDLLHTFITPYSNQFFPCTVVQCFKTVRGSDIAQLFTASFLYSESEGCEIQLEVTKPPETQRGKTKVWP